MDLLVIEDEVGWCLVGWKNDRERGMFICVGLVSGLADSLIAHLG